MLPRFDPTNHKACLSVLEDTTSNAKQVQDSVLEAILSCNAQTEYLRGFLSGQLDKQSFKKNLPIVTYEDCRSYIDRIANGESFNLICDRPFIVLLTRDKVQISPHEMTTCEDTTQRMFCQLLCGLLQRENVSRLDAPFASSFLKGFFFLGLLHLSPLLGRARDVTWRITGMNSNIRTGRVSDWITDAQCLSGISKFLTGPNPELAGLIEQECSKTSWEGIVKRLWPKAKCIEAIITGSMAQYIPMLEFYCGGLPLVSSLYVSSECSIGVNIDPLSKPCVFSYTIIPSMAYFEFLEVKKDHQETGHDLTENHVVVDLVDVKIGHDYEPVVTTFSGLYRYRVGDVLRVTGYYNNAPKFRFVGRQKVVLSIDMDKTYEEDLLKVVANATLLLEPHDLMLTDFTSRVDSSSFPRHYVLYWELGSKVKDVKVEPDPKVMEKCCFTVEESLDSVYRKGRRNDKNIGPLELKVVRSGAFDELMSFFVSRGSSVSQYKTPRSVTNEDAVKILEAAVVSKFVSRKIPSWELHELHSSR
uniref:Uncharacterized protein n=3 Tax=Brassica campestris TaxID=3711 RepID=M4E3Q3_BRACM